MDYLNSPIDWRTPEVVSAYDELPLWSSMAGSLFLEHLPLHAGWRVLDLGCGTGFPMLEIAQRLGDPAQPGGGSLVIGVDPWRAALRRAAQKSIPYAIRNAPLVEGSGMALPFLPHSFDLIVSNLGINNFSDPRQAFLESARVCRPGGKLALSTNLVGHMQEFYVEFRATLRELSLLELLPGLEQHIQHRATVSGVSELLLECRFRVEKVETSLGTLRYASGSALLRHAFIRLGFLDSWKALLPLPQQIAFFARLEQRLNQLALRTGEIRLTIPLAYIESTRI